VKVFAQDESRVGLLPILRQRITACGVQPVATVVQNYDYFYLYGAVEPSTGSSFFLELPWLNTVTFQLWVDHFAAAFPESFNVLILDNGAFHKAKVLQWPANVAPIFLPPYSPELNPIERLWRDLKDQLADCAVRTLDELSEVVGHILQSYSQAALQSLTGFAYFVQAVKTALQSRNG
jgi:transposase